MFGRGMVHQSVSGIEEVGFFRGIHSSVALSLMEIDGVFAKVFSFFTSGSTQWGVWFYGGGCTKFSRVFHLLIYNTMEAVGYERWPFCGCTGVAYLCALQLCCFLSGLPCWLW